MIAVCTHLWPSGNRFPYSMRDTNGLPYERPREDGVLRHVQVREHADPRDVTRANQLRFETTGERGERVTAKIGNRLLPSSRGFGRVRSGAAIRKRCTRTGSLFVRRRSASAGKTWHRLGNATSKALYRSVDTTPCAVTKKVGAI